MILIMGNSRKRDTMILSKCDIICLIILFIAISHYFCVLLIDTQYREIIKNYITISSIIGNCILPLAIYYKSIELYEQYENKIPKNK